jgi:predicted neuraminidase
LTAPAVEYRIEPRTDHTRAFLVVKCKHNWQTECQFSLWQRPAAGACWRWDGNKDRPTITPSIDCRGGCGRHFSIIEGRVV